MLRISISLCAVFALALGVAGCEPGSDTNALDEHSVIDAEPIEVSAEDLREKLEDERPGARPNYGYNGEILKVSGEILELDTEVSENHSKTFVKLLLLESPRFTADCYFAHKHQDEVKRLSMGGTLTLRGKCRGTGSNSITLSGCVIDAAK